MNETRGHWENEQRHHEREIIDHIPVYRDKEIIEREIPVYRDREVIKEV